MKKPLIFISIVTVILALVGIKKAQKQDPVTVNVTMARVGVIEESILASGNFTYDTRVQIRSEVTGRVSDVLVTEGQAVDKGDILIRLDDSAFLARLKRAEAQLKSQEIARDRSREVYENLQRRLKLHRKLEEKNLVARDSVDDLSSRLTVAALDVKAAVEGLKQARATLREARQEFSKSTFKAPISGVVTNVGVKAGETVVAGTTNMIGTSLLELADPGTLRAELKVDEADIGNINIGQAVKVFSVANPDLPIPGRITDVGSSARRVEPNRGLVMLMKVTLESYSQVLYPGMSCRAEIIYNRSKPTKFVPISAVQEGGSEGNSFFVWTVKEGRASRQPVTLGISNETKRAVLSGLDSEQEVVSGPGRVFSHLREGTRLNTSVL